MQVSVTSNGPRVVDGSPTLRPGSLPCLIASVIGHTMYSADLPPFCLYLSHSFFFFLSVMVTSLQHQCCCIPPSIARPFANWPPSAFFFFFAEWLVFTVAGVSLVASASTKINLVSGAEGVNILYCTWSRVQLRVADQRCSGQIACSEWTFPPLTAFKLPL